MVRVKVCGITNSKDAQLACELGAWAVGFIFYSKSPRYVTPVTVQKIIQALPKTVIPVGVFVNEPIENIKAIVSQCQLKAVQLHGSETAAACSRIKNALTIKAVRVKSRTDIARALRYSTDFILLDTYRKDLLGGTGKTFNWDLLPTGRKTKRKIILSGGLNPENIRQAAALKNVYAFDVASGVEKRPGKKCQGLMKKFFAQIQSGGVR